MKAARVKRPVSRLLAGTAAAAMLLWVLAVALLWWRQESMLFRPLPLPADTVLTQEPDVRERTVAVPGATLSVLELRQPAPRGVVFFLHGNSANLKSWFLNTALYRRLNLDLVMMDYRGFGKSTGRIESEAQLHADVRAVWQAVAPRYAGRRVVVYGRSLGSGLAARLAAELQPDLTVLVSPYESMRALATEHYPWVPPAVLRYPLRTDEALAQVRTPVLLMHGDRDTLIPPNHSERLLQIAPQARLVRLPQAGHGDIQQFDDYLDALAEALTHLPAVPKPLN